MLKLAKKFAIPNFAGGNKGEKTIKRASTGGKLCTFVCRHVHSINFEQICICSGNNKELFWTVEHPHIHTPIHTHDFTMRFSCSGSTKSDALNFKRRKAETNSSTQRPFPVSVCPCCRVLVVVLAHSHIDSA